MTTSASLSAPRLTGRKVLAMFVAFFGTIASADAILVTSAVRTWSGLEERSPYQASQRYNVELQLARAQAARGWILESSAVRRGEASVVVNVALRDRDGTPLTGKTLQARLERPTDKRADIALALAETDTGAYAGQAHNVARGQWDLVVEVLGEDGAEFRRRRRVVLD
ncbi:FixH family protein [Methylobacterium nigriterrae]|uniref:FixH family protein n=1 Tax=Methylobacterium nigriterrae TaxID=3127512 RepID=UPI003013B29D